MGEKEKANFEGQGRILILAGCYLPVVGGYIKVIHELAQRLVDLDYTVDILTCNCTDEVQHEVLDAINIHRLSSWNLVNGCYPVPTFSHGNISSVLSLAKNEYQCIITNTRFYPICFTKGFFLVTAHRAENVDNRQRLEGILQGLKAIRNEFSLPIVFPMHPRTAKMVQAFGLSLDGICVTKPLGYLDFLQLEANARLVLTDSGGLQEESCILGVPCVTLRDNTERPETVEVGANVLAGTEPDVMLSCAREIMAQKTPWANPFGDGRAGERIVQRVLGCF